MNTLYKTPRVATRYEQMFESFRKFHLANPRVWTIFKAAADRHASRGRTNYSAQLIVEEIRWHESMDGLHINNNFVAFYSRMYHLINKGTPREHFFRLRRRPSVERPPFLEAIEKLPIDQVDARAEAQVEADLSTL